MIDQMIAGINIMDIAHQEVKTASHLSTLMVVLKKGLMYQPVVQYITSMGLRSCNRQLMTGSNKTTGV